MAKKIEQLSISIGVDSNLVKSNLDQVQRQFRAATAGINDALRQVSGFADLNQQVNSTAQALNRAQQEARAASDAMMRGGSVENWRRAEAEVARLNKQLAGQKSQLYQLDASLRAAGVSTKNWNDAQKGLQGQLAQTRASYQQLAEVAGARDALGVRSHAALQAEIRRTDAALKILHKEYQAGRISSAEFAQAQAKATARIRELQAETGKSAISVKSLATSWKGLTAAMGVAGMGVAVKNMATTFAGFEDQMLRVKALSKATGDEFAALNAEAKRLGAETRYSASEAAAGMTQLAAAGQNTEQIIASIGPALNLAAVGGADLGTTADQLTNIMSQFGIEASQAGHVADVLTVGFTGAATTMDQLANAMTYVGPVAKSLGMGLEETTAVLQSLANAGYKGERAGTALRGGMTRLIKPTSQAREVLEQYGVEILRSDGTLRNFADIIEDLGKSSMSTAEMITLFGQEAGPGMMALVSQGADAIRDYQQALGNADGAAAEKAGEQESGLGGAMRRLAAAAEAVSVSFGETFGPALAKLIDGAASAASWVAQLGAGWKWTIGIMGGLVPVLATWALVIRPVYAAMSALPRVAAALAVSAGTASRAQMALNAGIARTGAIATASYGRASLAAGKFGAAVRTASAFAASSLGKVLTALSNIALAFSIGHMVGNWLNQFSLVRKGGATLAYTLDRVRLAAVKMWRAITGGDTQSVNREIENAKKTYESMLADIEKGKDEWSKERQGIDANTPAPPRQLEKTAQAAAEKTAEAIAEKIPDALDETETKEKAKTPAPDQSEDWLDWKNRQLEEKAAEKRQEEAQRNTRYRVYDENGKWHYGYGKNEEEVRELESRSSISGELQKQLKIVKTDLNGRQLDDISQAISRGVNERASALQAPASKQTSNPASKVVELKLGRAKLSGSDIDVADFIDELEQAGMVS